MSTAAIEACWLTALVVVPLSVNRFGTYPFSVYKAAFFTTLAGVMVAIWIVKAGVSLNFGRWNWHGLSEFLKTPLMLPALALAGFYVLSTLLSVSPLTSLWGWVVRMQGTYTTLALVGFFVIVAWNLHTAAQINRIIWCVIAVGSLVCLLGIAEWLGWSPWLLARNYGEWRITATIEHPTVLGAYLVLTTALLLGRSAQFWASNREQLNRKATLKLVGFGLLFLIQLTALLFTNARGSWLGFIAMIAVFFTALLIKTRRWRMLRLAVLILVLGVVFPIGLSQPTSFFRNLSDLPFLSRIAEMADIESGSGYERLVIWGATKSLIVNHPSVLPTGDPWNWARPVVGYGPETQVLTFGSVFPAELRYIEPGTAIDRAHNIILDFLVTVGLLGFLAFAFLIAMFFFYACRLLKRTQWLGERSLLLAALLAAIAGYLVTQLVGISGVADQLLFWTILAISVALTRLIKPAEHRQPGSQASLNTRYQGSVRVGRWTLRVLVALAALGIVVFSIHTNVNLIEADVQTRNGIELVKQSKLTEAATAFERTLNSPPMRAIGSWHLANVYQLLMKNATDPADQIRFLELASKNIEVARALEPAAYWYHGKAAMIYSDWALRLDPTKYDKAIEAFAQASTVSPNELSVYNKWADFEIENGNYISALDLLHRSLKADPQFPLTHYRLGFVYSRLARLDESVASYRRSIELFPTLWQVYLELSKVLIDAGKPDDAKPYAEQYVEAQPQHWGGRLILARVYLDLGMNKEAEEQATIALSLAPPSIREEIQQFIRSLR